MEGPSSVPGKHLLLWEWIEGFSMSMKFVIHPCFRITCSFLSNQFHSGPISEFTNTGMWKILLFFFSVWQLISGFKHLTCTLVENPFSSIVKIYSPSQQWNPTGSSFIWNGRKVLSSPVCHCSCWYIFS